MFVITGLRLLWLYYGRICLLPYRTQTLQSFKYNYVVSIPSFLSLFLLLIENAYVLRIYPWNAEVFISHWLLMQKCISVIIWRSKQWHTSYLLPKSVLATGTVKTVSLPIFPIDTHSPNEVIQFTQRYNTDIVSENWRAFSLFAGLRESFVLN